MVSILMQAYFDACKFYVKQKHLGCKKSEANQKQQLSNYG